MRVVKGYFGIEVDAADDGLLDWICSEVQDQRNSLTGKMVGPEVGRFLCHDTDTAVEKEKLGKMFVYTTLRQAADIGIGLDPQEHVFPNGSSFPSLLDLKVSVVSVVMLDPSSSARLHAHSHTLTPNLRHGPSSALP